MLIFEEIYFTSIPCVPHSPLISKTMLALPGPNKSYKVTYNLFGGHEEKKKITRGGGRDNNR